MHKLFYPRLAFNNLKKNRRTYLPYILTCIGTVFMFYNACALTFHPSMHGSTQQMMSMGTVITAIFSAVFLFYTNSFLVKRRKKEFGLFNILGMEKRHIGRIMLWESIFVAVFSLIPGLIFGIIFSKLITLLLYQLLHFDPNFAFEISGRGIQITVMLFIGIFFLILLNALRQVHMTQPAELLKGENFGEKEPKTKWVMAIIGVLSLGTGYVIALVFKNPMEAISIFLLAVILVIIGTYCLFAAGSIALLKLLKKNKRYYYQTKHFTTVSGMMYRMKQNAAGLANICIMSTAVIIMISTTVSTYVGMEDVLANRFPKDFVMKIGHTPEQDFDGETVSRDVGALLTENARNVHAYTAYSYLNFSTMRDGNRYTARSSNMIESSDDMSMMIILSADEYCKLTGNPLSLGKQEAAVYSKRMMHEINVLGQAYTVAQQFTEEPFMGERVSWLVDMVYVVVPTQADINMIYSAQKQLYGNEANSICYELSFDFADMSESDKGACAAVLSKKIQEQLPKFHISFESKQLSRSSFFELYGGLLFLGLFLGTLFLIATVLIIYYKQIAEGMEDYTRFKIMQKVGMSHSEVKQSVNSQILTIFALPLLAAFLHIIVAFPILTKLLAMLNLTNIPLFALCMTATALVFAVIYALVYAFTAKIYYKIVNN